jgi:hypothetical protein
MATQSTSPVIPRGKDGESFPDREDLERLFEQKYGPPSSVGWAPRRRWRFGYHLPAEVYEGVVSKLAKPGCHWLDVGGGQAIFPENPHLARELVSRCARVVAVDPSDNVHHNPYVHERHQCLLEEFEPRSPFDLATMRMVVEHVSEPSQFVEALARLAGRRSRCSPPRCRFRCTIRSSSWCGVVKRETRFPCAIG